MRVAAQAEAVARSITNLYRRRTPWRRSRGHWPGRGGPGGRDSRPVHRQPGPKASALAQVAAVLAGAGQHQQADRPRRQPGQLEAVARSMLAALAGAGQHQQAGMPRR